MKKIYLLLLLCLATISAFAQSAATYTFSRTSGTFATIVGGVGTVAISDVVLCGTNPVTISTTGSVASDDGVSAGIPIGFTFNFCGANYTTCEGHSNGVLTLAGASVASFSNNSGNITTAGWLMPLWDDLFGTCRTAYYQTTGVPGSRVFTLEWNDWDKFDGRPNSHLNIQVKLFEGTNIIQFIYGSSTLAGAALSATIGIANSNSDFQTLPTTGATNTNNSFTTSLGHPADGSILQFCPQLVAITGNVPFCQNQNITLTETVTGGTWTSGSPSIATVNASTGMVTGVSAGTATISYTSACGEIVTTDVTVNPLAVISGVGNICMGSSPTFTASIAGGTWSSSNPSVVTVGSSNGVVTTVSVGTADIVYTLPTTCMSSMSVTVNPIPTVTLDGIPDVCAGGTLTTQSFSGATNIISNTVTIPYTGAMQSWTVPAGVTSITVDAQGGAGGLNSMPGTYVDREGYGARVQTTLAVTPGQVLNIFVGGKGSDGNGGSGGAGGYNGGGNGSYAFSTYSGGGGGGASDIRIGGSLLSDRVVVAAGGGGAGLNCGANVDRGGDGGGLTGEDGVGGCGIAGMGGTPSAGGAAGGAGTPGILGAGGMGDGATTAGGGGGAGYYGGGGGSWAGGGGGSSYTDALLATGITHTRGYNTGSGMVTITYEIPTTYSIAWDPGATAEGFVDVNNDPVSSSPINIAVPATAAAGAYTGTLTMTNTMTGCATVPATISMTINPIPSVDPVASQTVCNGTMTSAINYTGSLTGTTFNWMNSDASIGVGPSSSGDIAAFSAINASNVPVTSVFTVTPVRLGCVGAVETFSITVNPTPDVNPSSNQAVCNGSMTTAVNFTGSVAGTTFTWSNTDPSIGLAASGTGDIAAFTGTNTTTATTSGNITVNTSANGCTGTSNSFTISVYPTPVLTSGHNPPAICDNTLFSYTPTSATAGTTFDWSRAAITGITNPTASGTDDPNEVLMNSTTDPINVMYVYTLTANGCTNAEVVAVVVNPTPVLSSVLTPAAICDSTTFNYIHASLTLGTTFTWSRAAVSGISNPAGSGAGDISEVLDNTTPNPITVTYIDTLLANGCMNTQTITVAVNPTPMLSSATVLSAVCDSTSIFYVPSSLTTGTTYAWSRAAIGGNPLATGTDTISGPIYNNTVNPINVVHVYTLTANGCSHTEEVSIVVYPTPMLNSSLTPPALCDSQLFNYTPTSATLGSAYAWTRPFLAGLGSVAGSGTGNPNEQLVNNTNFNLNVVYVYTITANGCTRVQNVTVVVHPTPRLSSPTTMTTCSGVNFHYAPTGFVSGSTFAWSRTAVPDITPNTGSGTSVIDETLVNGTLIPKVTMYKYIVTAYGCPHTQYVTVTVNPAPPALLMTTYPAAELCSSTMYQNFGVAAMPPAGQEYHWSATNANVWATGQGGQYALVSFTTPGEAVVMVKSNVTGFNCTSTGAYKVNVGTSISGTLKVVYFDGQLICLDPNQDSYQWGYDDGITLEPTTLAGEINPNYFISGPDFTHRYYWVKTKDGDCTQKTYYNAPVGITEINVAEASIKLYPNPATSMLNIEINAPLNGEYELDVVNLLGQNMHKSMVAGQKASIDVSALTPGIYLVDCYQNGTKIATQRFIKN